MDTDNTKEESMGGDQGTLDDQPQGQAQQSDDSSQQQGLPAVSDGLAAANPATPAPAVSTPASAEDVDLIEKAWVEKAKEIVDGTHGDPYMQSKQINQVKADYIKKRYNRDVKVDE